MSRFLIRGVVAAIGLLAAQAAFAQGLSDASNRNRHWEIYFDTRYQFEKDLDTGNGSSIKFDDDFAWGFGFNYNANERLQVGVDFGWNYLNYVSTGVDADDPTSLVRYASTASTGSLFVSGALNLLPKKFTPFVNGAVGWSSIDTGITAGYGSGCYWDPWWGYICGTYPVNYGTDAVVYRAGAGLRFDTSRTVFLKIGYNHQWTDVGDAVGTIDADQIRFDIGSLY